MLTRTLTLILTLKLIQRLTLILRAETDSEADTDSDTETDPEVDTDLEVDTDSDVETDTEVEVDDLQYGSASSMLIFSGLNKDTDADPTAIDSLILKPTRESIDRVTLIPTVKGMLKLTDSIGNRGAFAEADVELEIDCPTTLDTLVDTEADCEGTDTCRS